MMAPELAGPAGAWLTPGPVGAPIETLLLDMVKPQQPNSILRESILEELGRAVKRTDVVLEYLGLTTVGQDSEGEIPLILVAPRPGKDPWRDALLVPGGECPIGVVVNTSDHGQVALVHEVFGNFSAAQQDLVRRYVARAARGVSHDRIIQALSEGPDGDRRLAELIAGARRIIQLVDPSVLMSPDGRIRVQLGSLSDTTRNLLREGVQAEHVFVLPSMLFEDGTNYSDVEFLVYLNFFVRGERRTRIIGTAHQRETLKRLLTLTIFGLFDPAKELPAFEELHRTYGVRDPATYRLLQTAYEMYSVREGAHPASPILGIERYVEFIALSRDDETIVPLALPATSGGAAATGEVRVKPHSPGSVDACIVQGSGESVRKRLELPGRRRRVAHISAESSRSIQFATDRPQFGVTVLGTSHGFDPVGDVTSFVIWLNGHGILVDPSPEALGYLEQLGVAPVDLSYVFLTHIHADHDGGLLEKLLGRSRTTVLASDPVLRMFIEKARLLTGHDFEREGLLTLSSANPGAPVTIEVGGERAVLETRWNLHPIPTNGFKLSFGGTRFGYSGDTQYDPELIAGLRAAEKLSPTQHDDLLHFFWTPQGRPTVDLLLHEAGIPPIHTRMESVRTLPDQVKAKTFLVHIADKDVPEGLEKPPLFATYVLLPPNERVRKRILLDTLRRVSYLYDIPVETLEQLLRSGEVCEYAQDETIIRKGSRGRDEPLHFFVVTDGTVMVKDGRRVITALGKADSFGEWGISHQRGVRVADVVAARRSQCLRVAEAQYWWLVQRHPVIQERIGKIRRLLPRLELTKARIQLKAAADPPGLWSVMAGMTASQLSGFALFGETAVFGPGERIIREGDEADGFYVLLSGHLIVTVQNRLVGEVGEGEIFGELGLLSHGNRAATVAVVSADAEVLFMSRQNFEGLLEAVPAFSWGIRQAAAIRQPPSGAVPDAERM
jgi:CRP-like cAMP-binding protein